MCKFRLRFCKSFQIGPHVFDPQHMQAKNRILKFYHVYYHKLIMLYQLDRKDLKKFDIVIVFLLDR